MGILSLIKDVALLPVDVASDIITFCGVIVEDDPAIIKRLSSMKRNIEDTYDKE